MQQSETKKEINPKLLDLIQKSSEFIDSLKFQKLSNGETLAYREVKSSTLNNQKFIILIHGNRSDSVYYDTMSIALKPYFNIIAVDLRGYGDSTENQPLSSIEDFAEDLKLFCDELKVKKFTLVGLSLGGPVVQAFTCKYQEYVEYLVILSGVGPSGYPIYTQDENGKPTTTLVHNADEIAHLTNNQKIEEELHKGNYMYIKEQFDMLVFNTENKPEPEERYIMFMKNSIKQKHYCQALMVLVKFNLTSKKNQFGIGSGEIDKINCPTLVLHGTKDIRVPPYNAEETVREIGENARLKWIEGAGHIPFLENYENLMFTVDNILKLCNIEK